ncbi:MAG: hypothetical protein ACSW8D_06075, partial [Prevotella sp.]
MATSKLELAVDTGKWDAGLRKGQQALNAFISAQGGLAQALGNDNSQMQKFIQMMGKMDSTASTAKGQMNDYKRVLEQLTNDYNMMSDAQKKSIGQDYLNTIDQLKQKFQQAKQQVDEFNRSLNDTGNAKLPDTGGSGLFGGGKWDGALQVLGGNLMTKGVTLAASAVTNLASEVGDCVKQGIELARQGDGIRIAFERLGRGDILQGLREATHGTVTDIELMKAAVKFNDFKLPLDELGTMLAFAQQKAKDTGQSVDYMVDSIVTGLGRKSLMILDNLGLSATEVKDKMKETGDMTKAVGAIIREQMAKAGDYVETAADRAAQANVSLQNKMEELGRKFAPLQEASNNLWTSMKIGILDVIGGPLTELLNKLTEAGRMMNAYTKMGGSDKVGSMINRLKNARNPQSLYSQQQEQFWRFINPREQQLNDIRAWQSGQRGEALQGRISAITEKYGSLDSTKIQAEIDAAKKQLADYQSAARDILKPVETNIDTSKAIKNVDDLKKQLKELEAQRKAAVKAGDDEQVESLTKQINTTKQNIGYLDLNAPKTTGTDPVKQAQEKVAAAQYEYAQSIEKAKMSLDNGTSTEADYKKKLLSAEERLWDALGDAYNTHKDPKYREAQNDCAKKIKELGGEVAASVEAQKKTQEAARQLEQAQRKASEAFRKMQEAVAANDYKAYATALKQYQQSGNEITRLGGDLPKIEDKKVVYVIECNAEQLEKLKQLPTDDKSIKVNVEQGKVDLPSIPTDDKSIKVNVEQGKVDLPDMPPKTYTVTIEVDTSEAGSKVDAMVADMDAKKIEIPVIPVPKEFKLSTKNIDSYIAETKDKIANANLGESIAQSLESLSDATAIGTILQTAIQNGIDTAQFDTSGLMEKILNGEDIPNDTITAYVDQLNAMLKEKFDETEWPKIAIAFDIDTKSITGMSKQMQKNADNTAKAWSLAAQAVNSLGDAFSAIEDPGAKAVGTVLQAIASIALGFAQASVQASSMGPWGWVAFLAAGAAALATTISTVHSLTGYAAGGIVDGSGGGFVGGNSFSGDNIGNVRLNAGELVLNRAQQGILADELQKTSDLTQQPLQPYVMGEEIWLGMNNYLKRQGKGEVLGLARRLTGYLLADRQLKQPG